MKKKCLAVGIILLFVVITFPPAINAHNDSTLKATHPLMLKSLKNNMIDTKVLRTLVSNEGGNWIQIQKLLASDGALGDAFGYAVSIDGDTILIGAPYYNNQTGAAYVFTWSGSNWTQQAKLTASDGAPYNIFGVSVSVSGDTAFIGAPDFGFQKGTVYVFTRSGSSWTQQTKLTASDGTVGDWFGWSVFVSGDTALIGSPYCNVQNGSAYVFTRSGSSWTQQAKLTPSDSTTYDVFGFSVFMSGDTALIGAPHSDDRKGSAYVFTRSGSSWTQQAKLTASDGATNDSLGWSVSLSDDTALIGAYECNSRQGAAYVFTRSGPSWTQQAKLTASDGTAEDHFGYSVFVSSSTALIGAYACDSYKGAVYEFTRSGSSWTQQAKLTASDGSANYLFGVSISVSGDIAIIGSHGYDWYKGSAYVFINERPPTIPTISGPTTGKANQPYNYTFNSTDPNGNNVSFYIDWGDHTSSGWLGPYPSGDAITQSHTWTTKGTYIIKAKAKNIYGESDWGTLRVHEPLLYEPPHFRFFEWLLERLPYAFPILRFLLDLNHCQSLSYR